MTNKSCRVKIQLIMTIVIVIFIQFAFTYDVFAEDENAVILEEQAKSNEMQKLQNQLDNYSRTDSKELLPGYDPQKIVSDVSKGKFEFSLTGILNRILRYLLKEVYTNIDILIKLVILVILCAVLKNLQTSFLSQSVGELAFYACYVVIVTILLIGFNSAISVGTQIIDNMVTFMQATIPILITLLVSGGNITSAGIFQPLLVMVVEVAATLMKNIFIPLVFLSTVLSIVDKVSDKIQISKLAGFIRQVSGWTLGIILTIFIGIVSVQGSLGAVVDGVTGKTTKYALNTFIPVVGKYLSDAADAVVGCTLLIKNAAGIAAMVGIIAICLAPLLKILALIVIYKLTCVLIEPISEKRITNCINDVAGALIFIFGISASVAFMFLISVTIIISASNISAMIR